MLNKMLPNQIASFWDALSYGIRNSCPPEVTSDDRSMNDILAGLLSGSMQAWMCSERIYTGEETHKFHGFVITRITKDDITGQRNLLIFSLYMYQPASLEIWEDAYHALVNFAKANSCRKIVAYTQNQKVLEKSLNFSFDTSWSVIMKEI